MKDLNEINDKRLILLDALLRYAKESGDPKPHFYQDETLMKLGMCENVFIDMQMQIGDKCCHMDDCHDGRILFAINANRCLELRKKIIRASTEKMKHRKSFSITVATALYGMLFAIILRQFIM